MAAPRCRLVQVENPNTPWCNGNTAPFGGVIHGSNPCGVALHRHPRIGEQNNTAPKAFGVIHGSNPCGVALYRNPRTSEGNNTAPKAFGIIHGSNPCGGCAALSLYRQIFASETRDCAADVSSRAFLSLQQTELRYGRQGTDDLSQGRSVLDHIVILVELAGHALGGRGGEHPTQGQRHPRVAQFEIENVLC